MTTSQLGINVFRFPHAQDLPLPSYATSMSAGVDLMAAINHDVILGVNEKYLVPCGISIELPQGFEAQIRPRSGLALKHGITILNAPGTIDADYRGEIKAMLINHGQQPFVIEHGMRIAQMIIGPVTQIRWNEIDNPVIDTERGAGGFGSTGTSGVEAA